MWKHEPFAANISVLPQSWSAISNVQMARVSVVSIRPKEKSKAHAQFVLLPIGQERWDPTYQCNNVPWKMVRRKATPKRRRSETLRAKEHSQPLATKKCSMGLPASGVSCPAVIIQYIPLCKRHIMVRNMLFGWFARMIRGFTCFNI